MNEQYQYNDEDISIDLRDLCFYILKRWKSMVLVAIIGALLGGGYATFYNRGIQTEIASSSGETIEEELDEEQKDRENERERLEREEDRLATALEKEQEYLQDSLLMNIDPYHVYHASADILVMTTTPMSDTELRFLGQSIGNRAYNEDFLKNVAARFDSKEKYMSELFSVEFGAQSDNVSFKTKESGDDVVNSGEVDSGEPASNSTIIKVSVLAKSAEDTNALLAMLVEQLTVADDSSVAKLYVETTAAVVTVDRDLMDLQEAVLTRISNTRTQQQETDDAIKLLDAESSDDLGYKSIKKYIAVGSVGLLLGLLVLYVLIYVVGDKIRTDEDVSKGFGKNVIGSYPSYGKCDENIVTANLSQDISAISGIDKEIYCIGTIDDRKMDEFVSKLNYSLEQSCKTVRLVKLGNILSDPAARTKLEKADPILVVEGKGITERGALQKEFEVLRRYQRVSIGTVLL